MLCFENQRELCNVLNKIVRNCAMCKNNKIPDIFFRKLLTFHKSCGIIYSRKGKKVNEKPVQMFPAGTLT